jgi:two-component system cell cycle sensor histidine kinase/response regulator CckA
VDDARLLGHELKYAVAVASRVTEELGSYFKPGDAVEGRFTQLGRALIEADQIAEALLGNVQRAERVAPSQPIVDIDALITSMKPSIAWGMDPGIVLSFRLAGEGGTVFADEEELAAVIRRLIDGATETMPSGGELSISTGWLDHVSGGWVSAGLGPRRYMRISVADTGDGGYPQTWERVLSPRGPEASALSVTSLAADVAQMGGHLILESSRNEGSRIHVCLPAAQDLPSDKSKDSAN